MKTLTKNNNSLNDTADKIDSNTWYHFTGRIGRLRYLTYVVIVTTLLASPEMVFFLAQRLLVLQGIELGYIFYYSYFENVFVFPMMYIIIVIYSLRRLQDIGLSGWWCLLGIVPVANILFGVFLALKKGQLESNEYGKTPRPNKWFHYFAVIPASAAFVLAVYENIFWLYAMYQIYFVGSV